MTLTKSSKIGIVGGGAWGTALAEVYAFDQKETLLYAREREVSEEVNAYHHNSMYLKGFSLSPNLKASSSFADFEDQDVIILSPPAQAFRAVMKDLCPFLKKKNPPLVIASKGIEEGSGLLISNIIQEISPQSPVAVLSGPSLAHEVVTHCPTALTLAAQDPELCLNLQKMLSNSVFRLYASHDIVGVQIGGALKNVIAIAAGMVIGAQLGENARSALITRSLSEMIILGTALKASRETFFGLSGLGDLILTAMSNLSRNTSLGIALGTGEDLETILKNRITVTEGVYTSSSLQILREKLDLDLPICTAVSSILQKKITLQEAITTLLARPLKHENL